MYPAQVPRDCYQVTSDEEFKQIEESLKAQLAKGSRPTLQPTFTDPEISGRTIMLEHGTDNQEWVVLKEATELLLGEDMPKSIFAVRARYALALAKNGAISQSIEAAKQAYVEHPEDYESYGAMAASRLACAQPLEAAKWLSLVTAAGGSHNAWFKKMVKEQAFSLHIANKANTVILPLLFTPAGLERLRTAAEEPSDLEDASFLASVEAIRADPSCIQQQKESTPILLSLFNRIALTNVTQWNLPEVDLNQESAGSFAKLSPEVIHNIITHFTEYEGLYLKKTCKPLYSVGESPALWKRAWLKHVVITAEQSRDGVIADHEWSVELQRMIIVCMILKKTLDLLKEMPPEDGNKMFLPEASMDNLREYIASMNPVAHVFYEQPLCGMLYDLLDTLSRWPHNGLVNAFSSMFFPIMPRLLIGEPNCYAQKIYTLEVMTKLTSLNAQSAMACENDGYKTLANQMLALCAGPASCALSVLRTPSAIPLETPRLCIPSPPILLFNRNTIDPINFSGLFHLRATWNVYDYRKRLDFGICRLNFSDPTVQPRGTSAYKVSGFGHDTIRGDFTIKTFGIGYHHDFYDHLIAFLVEYADGLTFKFTGSFGPNGLSGLFDVFNPLMPEATDIENMDAENPDSLLRQGIKSQKAFAMLGCWAMIPEHETDVTKLKAHGASLGMDVSKFESDKYELWKHHFLFGARDDENETFRNIEPWRAEQTSELQELQALVHEWGTRASIFYTGQSNIYHIANMTTQLEVIPSDEDLATMSAQPVFTPPFGRKAEDTDDKHSRRSMLYHVCVINAYQLRCSLIVMLPRDRLRSDVDILRNPEHPQHFTTLRYWLELLSLGPWDNSTPPDRLAGDIEAAIQVSDFQQANDNAAYPDMSDLMSANKSSRRKNRGFSTATFLALALVGTTVIGLGAFALGRFFARKPSN